GLLADLRARYDTAVAWGITTNRLRDWHKGRHPGYNLARRLHDKAEQVWLFTREFQVSWTNDLASHCTSWGRCAVSGLAGVVEEDAAVVGLLAGDEAEFVPAFDALGVGGELAGDLVEGEQAVVAEPLVVAAEAAFVAVPGDVVAGPGCGVAAVGCLAGVEDVSDVCAGVVVQ